MTERDEKFTLSGEIGQYLFDEFCGAISPYRFGGETYELVSDEEYEALGFSPDTDPEALIIKRKSDGKCFEIELDASVYPVQLVAAVTT